MRTFGAGSRGARRDRGGDPDFVKVLDFGIAKLDDASVTTVGSVVGTPRYMSPEQLLGKRLDRRSDIYSAGIVLYEMLVGAPPFSSETLVGWVHQHVGTAPVAPSVAARRSKISPSIDAAVLRALAKSPADRPSSMEMFALEITAALNAPREPPRWRRAAVATPRVLASGARMIVRAVGSAVSRIGSGMRRAARAMGSATRRLWRAIGSAPRRLARARSPSIVLAGFLATPRRRFFFALLVVLVFAGLLAALFPEVRADFGLGGSSKPAKRRAPSR